MSVCSHEKNTRIAWIFPNLIGGNYWHPILSEFSKAYPNTIIYTGGWNGFSPGFEETFNVQVVGETKFLEAKKTDGYSHGLIYVSPWISRYLNQFRPQVIFSSGFSLWTLFIVLLKPFYKWQVLIVYDGSSPNVDYRNSKIRTCLRQFMISRADACITNSQTGKSYLIKILKAKEEKIFQKPYQVPAQNSLLSSRPFPNKIATQSKRPIFLFVGQLIHRKGLHLLIQACSTLKNKGYSNYTLQVIGKGPLREELEEFTIEHALPVEWCGWIDYDKIGAYFCHADVFVLPTLEDVWGMVVLESMVFGKPVLCSKWAGASEIILHGENGYIFDPKQPEEIVTLMNLLIEDPALIKTMGEKSKNLIAQYNPETAANFLAEVAYLTSSMENLNE